MEMTSLGLLFALVCEDPLRLTALHTVKDKRFLYIERTQQAYSQHFVLQLLRVTKAKSLTVGTVFMSMFNL